MANKPRAASRTKPLSVSVEDVAKDIFVKTFMDTSGKTPSHLAERAFIAAEAFVEVAQSRTHTAPTQA